MDWFGNWNKQSLALAVMEEPSIAVQNTVIVIYSFLWVWTFTLSILVLRWRNLYPMKERSPLLTTITLICFLVATSKDQLIVIGIEPTTSENDRLYGAIFLSILPSYGILLFTMVYTIKVIRILYTVHCKFPTRHHIGILKNETQLCQASLLICFIITIMCYIPYFMDEVDSLQVRKFVQVLTLVILQLIYLAGSYGLYNLQTDYSIQSENLYLFIYTCFLSIIFQFGEYLGRFMGVIPIPMITNWLFFFIFSYETVISPLRKSREYHKLQETQSILTNFAYFIRDPTCTDSFGWYLKHREENDEMLMGTQMLQKLLIFYFRVQTELETHTNDLSILFASVVAIEIRADQQFIDFFQNSEFDLNLQEVFVENQDQFSLRESNNGTVMFFFQRTQIKLHLLYEIYTSTNSYAALRGKLLLNERTNRNLELLNMTTIIDFM